MITIKNQSYPKHQRLDDLGKRIKINLKRKREIVVYLGDGRGLASGFYQAIVLVEHGPTLNINNIFCCFH